LEEFVVFIVHQGLLDWVMDGVDGMVGMMNWVNGMVLGMWVVDGMVGVMNWVNGMVLGMWVVDGMVSVVNWVSGWLSWVMESDVEVGHLDVGNSGVEMRDLVEGNVGVVVVFVVSMDGLSLVLHE
jgi:hypothetical protein